MEGETYYKYGVMLKKVANFYNNMASQVRALLPDVSQNACSDPMKHML